MEFIKAIIVDDEIEGINALDFMLEQYCPNVKVIQKYQSSVEALKNIKNEKPDLLFLDIKMPNINGMELLELLGFENYNAIFTTAYDEYILEALRMKALDYLKKPIDEQELVKAVARVKPQSNISMEQVMKALEHFKPNYEVNLQTPFGIKEGFKTIFVQLADIRYCKSDGGFTYVFLSNGQNIYSSDSLGKLEERLPEKYFFRCHNQYIINRHQIKEHDRADGGSIIFLVNNERISIPISKGRKDDFLDFLKRFL